jgi:hypothetical protein
MLRRTGDTLPTAEIEFDSWIALHLDFMAPDRRAHGLEQIAKRMPRRGIEERCAQRYTTA